MRVILFICLLLIALNTGLLFAHVLESPAKMKYEGELYITVQNSLYQWFGMPAGGMLEPAALISCIVLSALVRKRKRFFPYAVGAALLFLSAMVIYFLLTEPVNKIFRRTHPHLLPDNWMDLRRQWEYSHVARFTLYFSGFVLLLAGIFRRYLSNRRKNAASISEDLQILEIN